MRKIAREQPSYDIAGVVATGILFAGGFWGKGNGPAAAVHERTEVGDATMVNIFVRGF